MSIVKTEINPSEGMSISDLSCNHASIDHAPRITGAALSLFAIMLAGRLMRERLAHPYDLYIYDDGKFFFHCERPKKYRKKLPVETVYAWEMCLQDCGSIK